ncbi:class I SAM-dependent methyltransferase [Candidatus Woesearchaeota archaeon]|nr:class I SAM-dependent methyltransferase [Candidatus Woesearchaeota archaeon]
MKLSHEKVVEEHNKFAYEYDSYYTGRYNEFVREIELDILSEYLPKYKTVKILDAAGGTGGLAIPLAEKGYSNIFCVDLAEKMLRIGETKALKKSLSQKIKFIEGDITKLSQFHNNYFDFTFCFGTALSYCDAESALEEFKRVTKNKGFIVLDFKNFYRNLGMLIQNKDEFRVKKLMQKGIYSSKYHAFKEIDFRIEDIAALIRKSGLKLIKVLGKNTMYQYFSKIDEKKVNRLFKDKDDVDFFMQLDKKLREDASFIPLSLEIVAIVKKM